MKAILAALIKPLLGLLALLGIYAKGRKDAKTQTALQAAEAYAKTRKDMDHADNHLGGDPAVLRDWLRERGQQ